MSSQGFGQQAEQGTATEATSENGPATPNTPHHTSPRVEEVGEHASQGGSTRTSPRTGQVTHDASPRGEEFSHQAAQGERNGGPSGASNVAVPVDNPRRALEYHELVQRLLNPGAQQWRAYQRGSIPPPPTPNMNHVWGPVTPPQQTAENVIPQYAEDAEQYTGWPPFGYAPVQHPVYSEPVFDPGFDYRLPFLWRLLNDPEVPPFYYYYYYRDHPLGYTRY
ncbi:hypothetical protein QBC33DRAFT_558826 [Phialemonium atrogriseum]|uniref:Uncharacterized protein n=1 Tax=Phialemonium atrogriseum TaxID=1093897 RepID=A0AAJ0FM21_9PEZI|nr:uncharacterized protein QBC33DRAFT_558826 [Phialemonium atrogriseum]KAK1767339.1 hypothetical protein QBC33DRAFT_558826 [Phialemonium atrogriseum]